MVTQCVDQILPMSARTQNVSQRVLITPMPCLRGLKTYLKSSKYVLTKRLPCKRGQKIESQLVLIKPLSLKRGQ